MKTLTFPTGSETAIKNYTQHGIKSNGGAFIGIKEKRDASQEMLQTLVHEIRNPLTNIRLSVELLETSEINPDLSQLLGIIKHSTERINELTKTMLYSRDAAKELNYYSLNQLLDESLEMASDRIILKKVRVEKLYDGDLCEVLLEKSEIKIAFLNIMINAIEAMSALSGVLKISTSSKDGKCTVMIEDNGSGISAANMKKLFDPFFTTKASGIGYGLAATLQILQAQQAAVKVESTEGQGARFIISF